MSASQAVAAAASPRPAAWIGVGLDGTLAVYDGWKGPGHIGAAVPSMVARVRRWLAEGKDVRIFTARVNPLGAGGTAEATWARHAIQQWCVEQFGKQLPLTYCKDFGMIELWDDRCVQVVPNTGKRADGLED